VGLSKREKRRLKEAKKKAEMTHPDSLPDKVTSNSSSTNNETQKGKKGDPSLRC
jgi:hypothetical protein